MATVNALRAAITQEAAQWVDDEHALTIYMMDHGDRDVLYLDKLRNERLKPEDLDEMLDILEAQKPGVKVNVVIEACYSGSFISGDDSISKANRVVVTSVDDNNLAWASNDGVVFSDHFHGRFSRGERSTTALSRRAAAQVAHPTQLALAGRRRRCQRAG
ncbi:MAG: C13 family peptidase [Caldilineaceae bacterium]